MNTGGPAFPLAASTGDSRDGVYCQNGMTLLDWYAGQETLAEFDHPEASYSDKLATAFAGPMPQGGWAEDPHGMFEWEARVRAGMKYTRATAMIAEKARREADVRESSTTDHFEGSLEKVAKLEAANKELVGALENVLATQIDPNGSKACKDARAILAKHKGDA